MGTGDRGIVVCQLSVLLVRLESDNSDRVTSEALHLLLALVNPKLGSFNVTDKGLTVTTRSFDFDSVRYLLILGVLTAASLAAVPFWLILSPPDTQAVLINTMWCLFNLLLVVSACLVAFEQPQLRSQHRLSRQMPIVLHTDTMTFWGTTMDMSESGAQ